jgi:hypothetical protein
MTQNNRHCHANLFSPVMMNALSSEQKKIGVSKNMTQNELEKRPFQFQFRSKE